MSEIEGRFSSEEILKELEDRDKIKTTMNFSDYSDEQLEEELKRRERIENAPPDPLPSEDINILNIRKQAEDYVRSIHETGMPPKDGEHYMFKSVMTTFYGNDIWTWINRKSKG